METTITMEVEKKKTSYSYRLLAAIDSSIASGKNFVVGRGWSPIVNIGLIRGPSIITLARTSIVAVMSRISVGRLRVVAPEEQTYEFGPGGDLCAELKVVSDAFWVRLLLLGDLVRLSTTLINSGVR